MRASSCLFALILVLPALFATSVAHAEIKPIPRPAKATAKPAAAARGTSVAPLPKPSVRTRKPVVRVRKPVVRATKRIARAAARTSRARARVSAARRARPATTSRARRPARVLVRSRGGRYVPPALSHGGRRPPPLPVASAVPAPTPLGLVALGEALPSEGERWPAWVFSLLGVLAASEVFLLVHIMRARAFAEA